MRRWFAAAVLLISAVPTTSCTFSAEHINAQVVLGSYAYVSHDPEQRHHDWDSLTLAKAGTYRFTRHGSDAEQKGVWKFSASGNEGQPEIVLDTSGYPVQIRNGEVRLLIDTDVGIWWAKVK